MTFPALLEMMIARHWPASRCVLQLDFESSVRELEGSGPKVILVSAFQMITNSHRYYNF
jgi:hypothetical protein